MTKYKYIGKITFTIEDGLIHDMQYHYDGDVFEVCKNDQGDCRFTPHQKVVEADKKDSEE